MVILASIDTTWLMAKLIVKLLAKIPLNKSEAD